MGAPRLTFPLPKISALRGYYFSFPHIQCTVGNSKNGGLGAEPPGKIELFRVLKADYLSGRTLGAFIWNIQLCSCWVSLGFGRSEQEIQSQTQPKQRSGGLGAVAPRKILGFSCTQCGIYKWETFTRNPSEKSPHSSSP